MIWKIVETDNFGGDYPDERFVQNLPVLHNEQAAKNIAAAINAATPDNHSRYWKVVPENYELQPGFEP